MEVLRGAASSVRYTIHVSGGGDRSSISTSHHAIFKIGETTVMFTSNSPAVISDGDCLVVAGRLKGRVLIAEAYVNQTAGIKGDSGKWANFAAMLFFLITGGAAVIGLGLLGPFIPWVADLDQTATLLTISFGMLFCGLGLLFLYRWRKIWRAVEMVRYNVLSKS